MISTYFTIELEYTPGPLYGGDAYYHLGESNHLESGGSFFESSHYANEYSHYPKLSHFVISLLSKIFFLTTMKATILFAFIKNITGGIIFYLIGLKLFKKTIYATLLSLLSLSAITMTSVPSNLSTQVLIPLIFLCFFYIKEKKYTLPIGIIFGITSLAHVTTFLTYNLMLSLYFINELIKNKEIKFKEKFIQIIPKVLPIYVISFLISLLYWFPILFIYKAKTINNWQEYAASGLAGVIPGFITTLKNLLFNTSKGGFLFPIIIIIALIYVFTKYKNEENQIIILFFFTFVIGYLHPLITKPLLGTSVGYYNFGQLIVTLKYILIIYGFYILIEKIKNTKKYQKIIITIMIIQVLIFSSLIVNASLHNTWLEGSKEKNDFMEKNLAMAEFIKQTTNVNDVILTPHGETSFAIYALTGRKIVYMRRTHASPFVDANQREADAAVMMFGNNTKEISRLLQEYNAGWFYVDSYSIQEMQKCLQVWDLLDDPKYHEASYSCLRTAPEYEEYLNYNGVETKKVHARQDIASNTAPTFDLIAIKPNVTIINRINLIYQETINNQPILNFYEIK